MNIRDTQGRIFEIQRFSIHDGPGIRTTVFMKGCPLRCRWCHNPESMSPDAVLSFLPDRCIGCGACVKACPAKAHNTPEGVRLDRSRCAACGQCATECYAGALELVGKSVSAGTVFDEVMRDAPFYESSEGGMTLSGGEPTMQLEFSLALLDMARAAKIGTAVETCGHTDYARLAAFRPLVDIFLFDCKETDPAKHREFTGVSNELIQKNLRQLNADGARIWLRCPVVPGLNDREDHFAGIAALAKELKRIERVEIMPYHRLGEGKITRFGLSPEGRPTAEAPSTETRNAWLDRLEALGVTQLHRE